MYFSERRTVLNTSAPGLDPLDPDAQPVLTLLKKLRSSVRTGRKLHLDREEITILLRPEIYESISRLEAEEMRRACVLNADNDNKLGTIGSGSAPTVGHGASAGSNAADMGAMSRGARLRLCEAMSGLTHPRTR
jgi:hypothetical protein